MKTRPENKDLPSVGWREWVRLPDLGLPWMKAKIDTGAKTSALHAYDIEIIERDGRQIVRFKVHPRQRNDVSTIETEAELIDQRHVRSSHGKRTFRPVIRTNLEIHGQSYPVELTLVCRKRMKYRMLIGREALRDRFIVDTSRSFLGGTKKRKVKAAGSPGGEKLKREEK